MSQSRVFYEDDIVPMRRLFHPSEDGNSFVIETLQDAQGIVDINHDERNMTDKHTRWGDGQRVASIPLNVFWDLKRKGIVDDDKKFRAWLNDPDNRFFRTREGRV